MKRLLLIPLIFCTLLLCGCNDTDKINQLDIRTTKLEHRVDNIEANEYKQTKLLEGILKLQREQKTLLAVMTHLQMNKNPIKLYTDNQPKQAKTVQ